MKGFSPGSQAALAIVRLAGRTSAVSRGRHPAGDRAVGKQRIRRIGDPALRSEFLRDGSRGRTGCRPGSPFQDLQAVRCVTVIVGGRNDRRVTAGDHHALSDQADAIVRGVDDGCHFTAWEMPAAARLATVAKKPRRLLTRPAPRRAAMRSCGSRVLRCPICGRRVQKIHAVYEGGVRELPCFEFRTRHVGADPAEYRAMCLQESGVEWHLLTDVSQIRSWNPASEPGSGA